VIKVPVFVRWPDHIMPGTDTTRQISLVDILPTLLQAAGVALPANAPRLDGESLLTTSRRTTIYAEYDVDEKANPNIPSWKMIRRPAVKFVLTYDAQGAVIAREYYNLANDPNELTNLLGDASSANDPPAATVSSLTAELNAFATCAGSSCVR
jgi:arylsulfatase A-like enzyme